MTSVFDEPKFTDDARIEVEQNKKSRIVSGIKTIVRVVRACAFGRR